MRIDSGISGRLSTAAAEAVALEQQGYDGIYTAETSHDPFLPLFAAGQATERVELMTSIAVAFARNPMITAVTANDLHAASNGRFILGLGSQIKPHIEKRFSMNWSGKPASQMREFILAMRAIWSAWNDRTKLEFRGEYYTHTLMTPFFDPGPNQFGTPKVFLAGVGTGMTEVAGETCDGFLAHPFTTERYLREVTMPALEKGMDKGGRPRNDFQIGMTAMVVSGNNEEQTLAAKNTILGQIGFYGSTPAYKGVLELHGWGDLHTELNSLSKRGGWAEMVNVIDDDVLNAFAVVAEPGNAAAAIRARYGDVADRMGLYFGLAPEVTAQITSDLRAGN
jgi:probable F420-dependent oxidoreductase